MISEDRKQKLLGASERYTAYGEIHNLMGRAVFAFTYHQAVKAKSYFALTEEEVRIEVPDTGRANGGKEVAALIDAKIGQPLQAGEMDEVYLCTPVIEIDEMAKFARGSWWVMHAIGEPVGAGDPKAYWAFGKMDARFVRDGQDWKILELDYRRIMKSEYELGWVKDRSFPGLYDPTQIRANMKDTTIA